MAVGRYVGINMLVPGVAAAFIWWLLNRKAVGPARAFIPACAVQGGHAAWMLVGILLAGGSASLNLFDVCLLAGGLFWLMSTPSLGPIALLGIYQPAVLLYNVSLLANFDAGTFMHKAMVMHVALRVSALALLFVGWRLTLAHGASSNAGFESVPARGPSGMH